MACYPIGSANAEYMQCILEGANLPASLKTGLYYHNNSANDIIIIFGVPLPATLRGLKLYIDRVRVGIADADASDYLNQIYLYHFTDQTTLVTDLDDGTNRQAAGEYDYDFTAVDMSAAKRIYLRLRVVATTSEEFDLSYIQVRYYYDT